MRFGVSFDQIVSLKNNQKLTYFYKKNNIFLCKKSLLFYTLAVGYLPPGEIF